MARGSYYSPEEDKALKALYEDNKKLRYIDLADLAHKYGICKDRKRRALADHISALVMAKSSKSASDISVKIYEKKYNEVNQKYESVLNAIIGSAGFFADNHSTLKLNFRAIRNWVFDNEPERVKARIEELKEQMGD